MLLAPYKNEKRKKKLYSCEITIKDADVAIEKLRNSKETVKRFSCAVICLRRWRRAGFAAPLCCGQLDPVVKQIETIAVYFYPNISKTSIYPEITFSSYSVIIRQTVSYKLIN